MIHTNLTLPAVCSRYFYEITRQFLKFSHNHSLQIKVKDSKRLTEYLSDFMIYFLNYACKSLEVRNHQSLKPISILKHEVIHFESKYIKIQMRIQNDFGFFLKKLTWLLLLASPSLHLRSNIRPGWCPPYPTPLPTMFSISPLEVFQSPELFPKTRYANTYV